MVVADVDGCMTGLMVMVGLCLATAVVGLTVIAVVLAGHLVKRPYHLIPLTKEQLEGPLKIIRVDPEPVDEPVKEPEQSVVTLPDPVGEYDTDQMDRDERR